MCACVLVTRISQPCVTSTGQILAVCCQKAQSKSCTQPDLHALRMLTCSSSSIVWLLGLISWGLGLPGALPPYASATSFRAGGEAASSGCSGSATATVQAFAAQHLISNVLALDTSAMSAVWSEALRHMSAVSALWSGKETCCTCQSHLQVLHWAHSPLCMWSLRSWLAYQAAVNTINPRISMQAQLSTGQVREQAQRRCGQVHRPEKPTCRCCAGPSSVLCVRHLCPLLART